MTGAGAGACVRAGAGAGAGVGAETGVTGLGVAGETAVIVVAAVGLGEGSSDGVSVGDGEVVLSEPGIVTIGSGSLWTLLSAMAMPMPETRPTVASVPVAIHSFLVDMTNPFHLPLSTPGVDEVGGRER